METMPPKHFSVTRPENSLYRSRESDRYRAPVRRVDYSFFVESDMMRPMQFEITATFIYHWEAGNVPHQSPLRQDCLSRGGAAFRAAGFAGDGQGGADLYGVFQQRRGERL